LGGVGVGFVTTLGVGVRVGFSSPAPEVQLDYFLHHTLIPVEVVQFLLKLLLKQNTCCLPRFPLIANCYKTVETLFTLCLEPEWEILERSDSESDILPPTPQP